MHNISTECLFSFITNTPEDIHRKSTGIPQEIHRNSAGNPPESFKFWTQQRIHWTRCDAPAPCQVLCLDRRCKKVKFDAL